MSFIVHVYSLTNILIYCCQEDFKSLEGEYEKVSEELELAEEELRDAQTKKVGLTDALDELREQFMKLKVILHPFNYRLSSALLDPL